MAGRAGQALGLAAVTMRQSRGPPLRARRHTRQRVKAMRPWWPLTKAPLNMDKVLQGMTEGRGRPHACVGWGERRGRSHSFVTVAVCWCNLVQQQRHRLRSRTCLCLLCPPATTIVCACAFSWLTSRDDGAFGYDSLLAPALPASMGYEALLSGDVDVADDTAPPPPVARCVVVVCVSVCVCLLACLLPKRVRAIAEKTCVCARKCQWM